MAVPLLAIGADPYAVVAGTVFREPGFALPRAEVLLSVVEAPAVKKKPKEQRTQSDARGEFSFRVPAGAARYRISVSSPGFQAQQKEIAVNSDERVDVYFELKAGS